MAGICPKCSSKITHDFGIVSCHECGAILAIDFDGNISLSDADDQSNSTAEPVVPGLEVSAAHRQLPVDSVAGIHEQPSADLAAETHDQSPVEPVAEFESVQPVDFREEDGAPIEGHRVEFVEPASEPAKTEPEMSPEFQEDWINPEEPSKGPPPAPTGPVDFSDVVEYANSVELDNSPLVYAFRIEGIDHKDTRKKVLDVLSDIRLNIHVKDLIPTIKGGILELHDLSPVRASVIASRLREEAVTFRWRQSVFQSDHPSADSET